MCVQHFKFIVMVFFLRFLQPFVRDLNIGIEGNRCNRYCKNMTYLLENWASKQTLIFSLLTKLPDNLVDEKTEIFLKDF